MHDYFTELLGIDLPTYNDYLGKFKSELGEAEGDDGSVDDGADLSVEGAHHTGIPTLSPTPEPTAQPTLFPTYAPTTAAARGAGGAAARGGGGANSTRRGGGGDDDDGGGGAGAGSTNNDDEDDYSYDYACELNEVLVSKTFELDGAMQSVPVYYRTVKNKVAKQGDGDYTLEALENYVKKIHKAFMGFGRGWDRYIDNHLGITAGGTDLNDVVDTLYQRDVPYHYHPDCDECTSGSVWGAAPGALSMELQGSASTASGMQDMSLIDYCSPNSNGNMNRDPMDDQYDEVAYSFDFGKSSPDYPIKGCDDDDDDCAGSADDDDSPFNPDDE